MCSSNPCFNNGECLNGFTDKKYLCFCPEGIGYTGEKCNNGKTVNGLTDFLCVMRIPSTLIPTVICLSRYGSM